MRSDTDSKLLFQDGLALYYLVIQPVYMAERLNLLFNSLINIFESMMQEFALCSLSLSGEQPILTD